MELKRVVITGIGMISPVGLNTVTTWNNIVNGVSGSDLITLFDATRYKVKFACEVKGYNPENYFERNEIKKMDRFTQFAMIAADEAIKSSNLELSEVDKTNVGCVWASGIGGMETITQELTTFVKEDRVPRFSPFMIPKIITDITAGHISIKYGFMGANYATISACASSANSIIDAYNLIRLGMEDVVIAGGSEAAIAEGGIGGFQSMKALSTSNDDYKTASRPFCKTRNGFVLTVFRGKCS